MKLKETISSIKPMDRAAEERARARWDHIAKPLHSLGQLEELFIRMAGIQGTDCVDISKKALAVFCADNGVVAEGVTQTGQEVTAIVAENFLDDISCAALMCRRAGAELFPYDVGMAVDTPRVEKRKLRCGTDNMAKGPAMSREEAVQMVETGISIAEDLAAKGYRLFACGEMGIGNTTTSAAVVSVLLHRAPEEITGRGAGLSDEGLVKKIHAIEQAIHINRSDPSDPMDVLAKVGGFDLAALTGFYLGSAALSIPVVLDGFITAAAALIADRIAPAVRDYLLPSHLSEEPATKLIMDALGMRPILHAGMHLGEGTGAVALFPLLDMAGDIYEKMGTFDDIRVEQYEELGGESEKKDSASEMEETDRADSLAAVTGSDTENLLIITYTTDGELLGRHLLGQLNPSQVQLLCHGTDFYGTRLLLEKEWKKAEAILFISAAGIAVRETAPFLESKTKDPAVLVMDTKGQHIISLLSGHLGGANEWCLRLSKLIDAEPVITTATDLHGRFAVDLFAKKNGLLIEDPKKIKEVSARLLRGETVGLWSDTPYTEKLPEGLEPGNAPCGITIVAGLPPKEPLYDIDCRLSAKNLWLGIGCRRGKRVEELEWFVTEILHQYGVPKERLCGIASIDLKKDEEGLIALADRHGLPFKVFTAEELNQVPGDFHSSSFVKETTGTDNVAERSSIAAANGGARLLIPRQARDGMTLAVAAADRRSPLLLG